MPKTKTSGKAKEELTAFLEENKVTDDPTVPTEVIVKGRKITVHPGTFVMALRREMLRKAIVEKPSESIEEQVARYNFYAPMAACSTGEVFTEEEFLKLDETVVDVWYQAVVSRNPNWFEDPTDEEKKSLANELYSRIVKMIEDGKSEDLPDTVDLTTSDLETYWKLWTLWRATDRRFLPSQLLNEPERPLHVMIELDGVYSLIERQVIKQSEDLKNGSTY